MNLNVLTNLLKPRQEIYLHSTVSADSECTEMEWSFGHCSMLMGTFVSPKPSTKGG